MTWARLDDSFPTHPKIVGLSDAAFRLHVSGICYCAKHMTDGFIPKAAIKSLNPSRKSLESLLKTVWGQAEGGYKIHDYLDYNPSREEVEQKRCSRSDAGKAGAAVRWGKDTAASKSHSKSSGNARPHGDAPIPSLPKDLRTEGQGLQPNPLFATFVQAIERATGSLPSESDREKIRLWSGMGYTAEAVDAAIARAVAKGIVGRGFVDYASGCLRNGIEAEAKPEPPSRHVPIFGKDGNIIPGL